MTISSIGYDGTITETQWADLTAFLGRPPCVADETAWAVSSVVGPDRTVRVGVGPGFGHGVLDTSTTTVDVQLATIATGTRWDAVVARRDWTPPGGTTTFTSVAGTAAQALPSGLLVNPGVSSDQVLALVQLTAGQSTPTAVVDMRALPTNAVTYPSVLALPPDAASGALAMVAGREYVKTATTWELTMLDDTGWLPVINAAGFGTTVSARSKDGRASVKGVWVPLAAGILTSTWVTVATLPEGTRPISENPVMPMHVPRDFTVDCQILTSGVIQMRTFFTGADYTTNSWFSLSGLSWLTS